MLQQDSSHCRIQYQIMMVEKELSQLTKAEMQHRDLNVEIEKVMLESRGVD